jgi:hypothetical protein
MARKKKSSTRQIRNQKPAKGNRPKYPRDTVSQALRIPRAILQQNAGKGCTDKEAAGFLGLKIAGAVRLEIGSAIKYGFLERPSEGMIVPTDLAKIIIRPQKPSDEVEGYRKAILNAPDIADVYKYYRGENIPDDTYFRNTLESNFGIPNENFADFKQIFIQSLETAKLITVNEGRQRVLDITGEAKSGDEDQVRLKKTGSGGSPSPTDICFVMQPYAPPLGDYYEKIYKPAIQKAGMQPVRADAEIFGTGKIMDQVWEGINAAKVLVAELTSRNPNVFYELGLSHALRKPVVLISSNENDVPFDLKHIRVIYYDVNDPYWGQKLLDKVAENILSAIKNPEEALFPSAEKDKV